MKRISDTGVYQMQAWIAMLSCRRSSLSADFRKQPVAVLTQSSWQAWGGVIYTALGASLTPCGDVLFVAAL